METTQKEINWKRLKEPFPVEAHSTIPNATAQNKTRGLVGLYVDSRYIMDRFDEVFGDGGWSLSFKPIRKEANDKRETGIEVSVLGRFTAGDVVREDFGIGQDEVSATTHAIKRIGTLLGVGRYLYHLPKLWADLDQYGKFKDEEAVVRRMLGGAQNVAKNGRSRQGPSPTPPDDPGALRSAQEATWNRGVSLFGQSKWASDFLPRVLKQYNVERWEELSSTQIGSINQRLNTVPLEERKPEPEPEEEPASKFAFDGTVDEWKQQQGRQGADSFLPSGSGDEPDWMKDPDEPGF